MNEFEKVYLNLITEGKLIDFIRKIHFRKIFNDKSVFLKFLQDINCLKYYKCKSKYSEIIESILKVPILDLSMEVSDEIKLLFIKRCK